MKTGLLAYDGGEPARRALDQAVESVRRFDASCSVSEHLATNTCVTVVVAG
jgi:hypothetical protein